MRIPLAEVKKWKKVFQRGTVKIRTGINSLAPRPYLHSLSIYAKIQESNEWREIPVLTVLMVVDIVVSVILIASVLLQSGKSSGFAGLGGGESMFSGKPTDMDEALSRITVVFGLVFAVLNIVIARLQ